tara:strand:- start:2585 stop:2860 length:276 start_codon:yes stop_codon:yes gene_type:complete
MNKFYYLLIIILLTKINLTQANEPDCNQFKKFSAEFFKCKGQIIKNKTLSTGKKIIKDTKEFQDKEWSDGKKQINNTKKEVNKLKEKVINQ